AVHEQISALIDQGRQEEAGELAQRTYMNALEQRKNQIKENLGVLESAWGSLRGAAASAWDAMLNVGRETTLGQRIEEAEQRLEKARSGLAARSASGKAAIAAQEAALDAMRNKQALEGLNAEAAAEAARKN